MMMMNAVSADSLYLAGFIYVVAKYVLEYLMDDMYHVTRRISMMIFNFRIVQFSSTISNFVQVAEWIGGGDWSFDEVDFLSRKHASTTIRYSSSPPVFGPLFDDGLQQGRLVPMFGFTNFIGGPRYPWIYRKFVQGWPVWFVADGIHAYIADKHRVLHKNSARFGKHQPAVLIVTFSFTPRKVLEEIAQRLKITPDKSGSRHPPGVSHLSFRNYQAIIRTESKLAELEWILRNKTPRLTYPNPLVTEAIDVVCGTLRGESCSPSRLNVLLFGTYGTGKTNLVQWTACETGAHLVIVTKGSRWTSVLDAIYNTAPGPKILLFDEFDTFFKETDNHHQHHHHHPATLLVGHGDKGIRTKESGGEPRETATGKSFLCTGGSMNFRKVCAGFVREDEEDSLRESIQNLPDEYLDEHHLLGLLDGSSFGSYAYPVVCFICTNFPDRIPARVSRWGRINLRLEMLPHTLESALAHAPPRFANKVKMLFRKHETITPGYLQSMLETGFVGVDS